MNESARYVKLGLFVLAGLVLAAGGAAILGGGSFFRDGLPIETFVDESVQGLNVGTQIKLLGVTVGRVVGVGFAPPREGAERRVRVRGRLDLGDLPPDWRARPADTLRREVSRGLRARLTSVGLSGQLYLELSDFPDAPPPAAEPDGAAVVIPAVPSLQERLFGSAEDILAKLADIDLSGFERLVEELGALAAELRRGLPGLLARLDVLLGELSRAASGQGAELGKSIENLRALTEDLRRIASRAERDPGGVLFGSPPPPVTPGKAR